MDAGPQLHSERLLLRRWRAADLEPWAALNADPVVMEHFPGTLSAADSAAVLERQEASFAEHGYGLWAVELSGTGALIGAVGLLRVELDVPFAGDVEVGWRIARRFWARGLACEAATTALGFGFSVLELAEIIAYTAARNARSRRLMERLGMTHDADADFCHPGLAPGDPLAPHVLYRLAAPATRSASDAGSL